MSKIKRSLLLTIFLIIMILFVCLPRKTTDTTEKKEPGKFDDVKYFPLAAFTETDDFPFEDSFGDGRSFGGDRVHEGTDIMTPDNIRGTYPVISVCDGTVENIGWLELGGYRVGILSENNVYYYYAHLYRYDTQITEGCEVKAGQIIGYAGDSGYGEEGTTGQFPVHLHFGIYVTDSSGNEIAINPYPLLKKLRNKILKYF